MPMSACREACVGLRACWLLGPGRGQRGAGRLGYRYGVGALVLGGRAFSARLAALLRELGWDVQTAADAAEARRLALRHRPHAVLLAADADDESGFLSCAKLRLCLPRVRVVLVAPEKSPAARAIASKAAGSTAALSRPANSKAQARAAVA